VFDTAPTGGDRSSLAAVLGELPPREPPVCGEWSFDVSDDFDSRAASLAAGTALAPSLTPELRPTPIRTQPMTSLPPAPVAPPVVVAAPAIPVVVVAPAVSVTPPVSPAAPPAARPAPPAPPATAAASATAPSGVPSLPALAELKSLHDAQPGDAASAIALATMLDQRGNIQGALSVLLRSIEAGADGVALRCARATILAGRLRFDDAEAELQRAAKLRAGDNEVLLLQGILACRRAKWREAVEPLTHVVKIDPSSAAAHFYLGEALSRFDRLPEALAAYERATELEATNWRAWKGAGMVLDRLGRSADAATFYRRARDVQRG